MTADLPDLIGVFDEAATSYDDVGVDFFTPMGAELVRHAGIRPGDRVLDVGCGRGAVLLPAAAAAGPTGQVIGIDLAPTMVALTRAAVADLPTATVDVGDAQAPGYPPGSFDVVTAGLVVFFLPDPLAALAAYRKLLRPGGRLAFTTFAAYDPLYPRAMQAVAAHAVNPDRQLPKHPAFASEESIRAALAAYSNVRITEFVQVSHFDEVGQWMDWVASHGGRQLLRRIPAERLPAAAADAAVVLEEARTPDGSLALTTKIRVIVADR